SSRRRHTRCYRDWSSDVCSSDLALIGSDPERFFRPPYVGVSGWVGVVLDTGPDWDAVAALVREAYLTVATPKLRNLAVAAMEGKPQARSSSPRRAGPRSLRLLLPDTV